MSAFAPDAGDLTPDEMYRRDPVPHSEPPTLDLLESDNYGDETVNPDEIREAA